MNKKLMIIITLALIGCFFLNACNSKKVETDTISAKLENASDFTTQKLIYNGLVNVTQTSHKDLFEKPL